jgi:acetoacetyl-CoA reductase
LGGIGSEICRQLVAAGYKIIATVVPREEDREKQWLINEGFNESDVRFILTDLTKHEEATVAINEAIEAEGRVDVLVNNAGITRDATFKK